MEDNKTYQMDSLNEHGDILKVTGPGHGADISFQRADELDLLAIESIKQLRTDRASSPTIAVDLASGRGAQALRMAQAGADIAIAIDAVDFSAEFIAAAEKAKLSGRCRFIVDDMRAVALSGELLPVDVVVCQRAIHYLPWHDAQTLTKRVFKWLRPGGRIFISASGLGSELGNGYVHANVPIIERFAPLSQSMAEKHGIGVCVCLFDEDDISRLGHLGGFEVERVFSSSFGNVKGVWIKPE